MTTALKDASSRTGVSFDYLVKTAQRESRLDPDARAASSSASGLFQFLEQTWLGLVKSDGDKLGMANVSGAVVSGRDGRLTIADPQLKAKVLALRDNPEVAATAAGVFTVKNREALTAALRRPPTDGELYIAHFLGAGGAAQLVKLAEVRPGAQAASYFSDAADANRGIFYERSGRPRTAAEVYHALIAGHESARQANPVQVASAAAQFSTPVAPAGPPGKPLLGLFRSLPENAAGHLQKAWLAVPGRATTATLPRTAFFPRSDGVVRAAQAVEEPPADGDGTSPADSSLTLARADVPLPPERPQAAAPIRIRIEQRAFSAPLDLLSFMNVRG